LSYQNLSVWQASRELVKQIYLVTADFPKSEQFGLTGQLRRAAISIPCNIAEGYGRKSARSYSHFLRIAKGSVNELETLLLICEDLNFLAGTAGLRQDCNKIGSMLSNLERSILRTADE